MRHGGDSHPFQNNSGLPHRTRRAALWQAKRAMNRLRRGRFNMRRREFITLLGSAAVVWPLAGSAQPSKLPTIGVVGPTSASVASQWTATLLQRLRELGWIEGRTVAIE